MFIILVYIPKFDFDDHHGGGACSPVFMVAISEVPGLIPGWNDVEKY